QLELLLVAGGDTLDHVGQVGAGRAGARAGALGVGEAHLQGLVLLGHDHVVGHRQRQGALGALDGDQPRRDGGRDALRQGNRILGYSRHVLFNPYATMQRTSPPWPMARAWRSVITPWGVETITVPMPPSTFGSSSLPRYTRRPGRLTRSRRSITGLPS